MSSVPEPQYPGNPSLPREVRDKILSTFRHTLNLFKESKIDDCLIGCDFILKMDPRFAPARQLLDKAKNPAAAVDVATLEAIVAETPTRQERVASVESDRLLVRAAESLNARDFDAAIASAEQVLQVLPGNQNAMEIQEKARQGKNAAPQFEVAKQRAIAALDGHRMNEARAALDKMRSLDPDHPSVALLASKIDAEPQFSKPETGESTNPGFAPAAPAEQAGSGGGLDDLSLDSLSLDEDSSAVTPPTNFRQPMFGGPLAGTREEPAAPAHASAPAEPDREPLAGAPPDLWNAAPETEENDAFSDAVAARSSFSSQPSEGFSGFEAPAPSPDAGLPSQENEIETLLTKGDEAAATGNRQQAIEIWSRIFLIDINNSDAVARIEKARQDMAEGNKRVAEALKRGREKFEAGDFTAAREAFLEVAAADESDATARSYLDRIEQELARPSSGLDLARKTPEGDILAEEFAETAEAAPDTAPAPSAKSKPTPAPSAPRKPLDKRFLIALGGALLLTVAVGAYYVLRGSGGRAAAPAAGGGPSLEHATMLFRDGKINETIAELKQIPPENADYARAQKLLGSLTKRNAGAAAADGGAAGSAEAPASDASKPAAGPPPEAVQMRAEGEKALSEKRYIDALKSLKMAESSYQSDPTFAPLVGQASEKVAELTPAVKLYNEGEYETAVPILWRIFQTDRSNQDARSYLLRSYYNQGVAQLQNGLYPKAIESFTEVLDIAPDDADATRHKKFAQRYLKGDLDLMGRIYVRHITQRP
ncbi:MAG TPA: tetratricopeptide repeat protein [Thermoanaerobaculia bacterium]|jgi:tetratricopeptide (TPR) repeat protein